MSLKEHILSYLLPDIPLFGVHDHNSNTLHVFRLSLGL